MTVRENFNIIYQIEDGIATLHTSGGRLFKEFDFVESFHKTTARGKFS